MVHHSTTSLTEERGTMNRRDMLRGMLGGLGIAATSPLLTKILGAPDAWALDSTISALPAATALTETDVVPIVQGGITKKADINLFDDFVNLDRQTGVDPTGVVDSYAAIQAVLDTGVRSVYAPSTYKVNTGLQLREGHYLEVLVLISVIIIKVTLILREDRS